MVPVLVYLVGWRGTGHGQAPQLQGGRSLASPLQQAMVITAEVVERTAMTPASIVLVASLLALVTPAVAVTNLKTDNTAVLEIDDETLTAKSFAPAAKSWGVDCNCAIERGKI